MHVFMAADDPFHCGKARWFKSTLWTVVLNARDGNEQGRREALETLCRTYWQPVYAFVRRSMEQEHEQAQDLTQAFFEHLIGKELLTRVERSKGKFRSWLLACVKHFVAHELEKARAGKRGGGLQFVPVETPSGEAGCSLEPGHNETPDKLYNQAWAKSLTERVMTLLERECVAAGKGELFAHVQGCLVDKADNPGYEALAGRAGISASALKQFSYRLRLRYRELLRQEIAQTVESLEDVDEELRHLVAVLRG
jgi:DNA-directed RNA polymerase specialized sigma24 family protein